MRHWRRVPAGLLWLGAATVACAGGEGGEVATAWPSDSGYVAADDGVRLFYRTVGDGPLNVVIPAALYLEEALLPLAAADRRLVFYDPRARGRSEAGDRSLATLDRQLADVEAIRIGLGIDSMVLIGWSGMGMEMAVYTMRHPERVIRLIQLAPVAARDEPHNSQALRTRAERVDTAAVNALFTRRERGDYSDDPIGFCRMLREVTAPASLADTALLVKVPDTCVFPNEDPDSLDLLFETLLESFADYDWRTSIAAVTVPRLVIHGARDAFPVEGSREWVPAGSNARLLVIGGAAHFPFLERPKAFFSAVEAFLGGEWPKGVERVRE